MDRYIIWPGQATPYMVGRVEIERLRRQAESRLGFAFDIRAFHDRILENGSAPLTFLKKTIADWLASAPAAATNQHLVALTGVDGSPGPASKTSFKLGTNTRCMGPDSFSQRPMVVAAAYCVSRRRAASRAVSVFPNQSSMVAGSSTSGSMPRPS